MPRCSASTTTACRSVEPGGSTGSGSVIITSSTRVSSRRPIAPPGCRRAKSSRRNPLSSSNATASASPSASAAVVLVVGREVVRARLLAHPRVERHVAQLAERRARLPGDGDRAYPEPLQMFEQPEQLVGLPALGDEDRDVVSADDAEVAVDALRGMQEDRRRAGRRERRGDLAADRARTCPRRRR